jgi:hypothetical protein
MENVTRTERGWAGHFICANRCRFRRNTLLEYKDIKIVVSTVGLMENLAGNKFDTIGHERYFETMCFHADPTDKRYKDIDVQKEISFESNWSLNEIDADDKANEMHENVVNEITSGLLIGLTYPTER